MTWNERLTAEKEQPYYQQLQQQLAEQRAQGKIIYPPEEAIFNALALTEYDEVKVVILGQDPYHGVDQAHGLSFSVLPGITPPPSLKNIYKELQQEFPGFEIPEHGCLQSWATQGVLLLNTVLTVEAGKAHSHAKLGWERFTTRIIQLLNEHQRGLVFLLWGGHAQKKGAMIDTTRHLVLTAPHPSPLSAYRGFFGCNHFLQANEWLVSHHQQPIDWQPKL